MKARQSLSLKGRALQLLAQRDQSKVELRRKLQAHARAAARPAFRVQGAPDAADAGCGIGLEPTEAEPAPTVLTPARA